MITDNLLLISGRIKEVKEIYRLLNKGVSVVIFGEPSVGKTEILRYVYEAFVNTPTGDKKFIYLKSSGTKPGLEQVLFVMSEKYKDIYDSDCKEQSFDEFRKGSQQQLERRILTGIKNASGRYILFIEEKKKPNENFRLFLQELLKTGKVTFLAETSSMNDKRIRGFYHLFDQLEIRRLNDQKMSALFDYLARAYQIRIKDEDYQEIKQKLIREFAGIPGRLVERLQRATKEREIKKEEIIEAYPNPYRKEYPFGMSLILLVVMGMAYRYFLRKTGNISDAVMGGCILAVSLLFYKAMKLFK